MTLLVYDFQEHLALLEHDFSFRNLVSFTASLRNGRWALETQMTSLFSHLSPSAESAHSVSSWCTRRDANQGSCAKAAVAGGCWGGGGGGRVAGRSISFSALCPFRCFGDRRRVDGYKQACPWEPPGAYECSHMFAISPRNLYVLSVGLSRDFFQF